MPMTGRSLEIASSTSFTDFLRPTSMGMIDPGNSTEFRSGRIEMTSGTSTGPSGTGFLVAMVPIVYARGLFRQSSGAANSEFAGALHGRVSASVSRSGEPHGKVGIYLSQEDSLMRLTSLLVLTAVAAPSASPQPTAGAAGHSRHLRRAGHRRPQSAPIWPGSIGRSRPAAVDVWAWHMGRFPRSGSPPHQRGGVLQDRGTRRPALPLRGQDASEKRARRSPEGRSSWAERSSR